MDKNKIAERLVSLRGNRRREEVAAALQISVTALALYETGKRIPRDEVKTKMSNYYGVSVQALFFD